MYSSCWLIFHLLSTLIFCLTSSSEKELETRKEQGTISAVATTIGRRSYMEDYFIRVEGEGSGIGIYAIFDGHSGKYSANFAKEYFTKAIGDEINLYANAAAGSCKYVEEPDHNLNFKRMLTDFIEEAESQLKKAAINRKHDSGATCLLVIAEERKLTVANLGDSRGVMCDSNGVAIDLSIDHKPDNPKEKERIEKAGEKIHHWGVWRVRGLAMSRALGDYGLKLDDNIIITTPDLFTFDLDEHQPKFMILASDGLWDVMSSQEAVNFIKKRYSKDKDFGAKALMDEAYRLRSSDNIAVLIVVFKNGHYEVAQTKYLPTSEDFFTTKTEL